MEIIYFLVFIFALKCALKVTYVAHLDGVAYLGTVAVAKTGFNTVSWRP